MLFLLINNAMNQPLSSIMLLHNNLQHPIRTHGPIHYALFWQDYFDYCELDRLRGIFAQIDLTEVRREIRLHRSGKGRQDWPIEAMLQAVLAMIVLQHRSVASFRRELMRNPTLMIALGFELKAAANGERNPWARYRVPMVPLVALSKRSRWMKPPVAFKRCLKASQAH